jgi:hypothetical protein
VCKNKKKIKKKRKEYVAVGAKADASNLAKEINLLRLLEIAVHIKQCQKRPNVEAKEPY